MNTIVPIPKCPITIRQASMEDLSFIDRLQKMHGKMVGFMPTKALEGKIAAKQVIVAEEGASGEGQGASEEATSTCPLPLTPRPLLGYCIGQDQYFKRDDVGIIYQMNVLPAKQRGFIGATLVKAMFDRASYACRLFCLWCAQDIDANYFWESLGFVPLAFRAGSRAKSRVHIFWQKRVREGDTTTNWWLPTQTSGGAMGEDRLVLPIPPGTRWSDAKPLILPKETKMIEAKEKNVAGGGAMPMPKQPTRRFVRLGPPPPLTAAQAQAVPVVPVQIGKPKKAKKPKAKNDPAVVAKVRELNARWLEQVNADPSLLLPAAKYEACKTLPAPAPAPAHQTPQLPPAVAA